MTKSAECGVNSSLLFCDESQHAPWEFHQPGREFMATEFFLDDLSLSRKAEFKESLFLYLLFFSAHSSPNTPKQHIWGYHALNSHSHVLGWHLLQPSEHGTSVALFSSQVLRSVRALGVMGAVSIQSS